jgi:hypothetical protein
MHGITTVHFLFPSRHQGHLARDAKDPHYQSQFADVVAAMKEYKGNVLSFIFYDPLLNHSTNFLSVINGWDAKRHTDTIDWDNVSKHITTDSENKSSSATSRQAPGNSSDYGFCSSQCSGRKGSDTGHAMPQIKPNSTVPEVRDAFVALTSFAENTPAAWRPGRSPFESLDPHILSEFANKIDKNNLLPSLHLATTSPRQPCGCHNNRATNSLSLSEVVCLSVIVKGERTSCNAQQLKSIDDYQKRVNDQGDAIGAVVQVFQDMEASRQTITSDLFSGKKATILFQVSK